MIRTRFAKAAGIFFVLMMLFGSIFQVLPLRAADGGAPVSKISSLLSLRTKIKSNYIKNGSMPQGTITLPGGNIQLSGAAQITQMNHEKVFIYFVQKPSTIQLGELAALGVTTYPDSWIPPVTNHPTGFILADIPVDQLDALSAKNYIVQMDTAEEQSSPQNDLAEAAMNVGSVWTGGDTGAGVTVAVLDSGIDATNPDFPTLNTSNSKDYSAYPTTDDTITNTVTGHGTHVAGSVLGRGVNSSTYKGVAYGANLVFLKIGNDTNGSASTAAIVAALHAAVDTYNAKVITMSYGGWSVYHDGSDAQCQAVDYAVSHGATVFISAGNNGSLGWHCYGTLAANSTTDFIPVTLSGGTGGSTALAFNLVWYDGLGTHNVLNLKYFDPTQTELTAVTRGAQSESTRGTESQLSAYNSYVVNNTYYVKVQNTSINSQLYQIYYDSEYNASGSATVQFTGTPAPSPLYTLFSPAEADGAIAVGSYVTRTSWTNYLGATYSYTTATLNSISTFSDCGPRVDTGAPNKPEIVAPGQGIISVRDRNVYPWPAYNTNADIYPYAPLIIDNDGAAMNGSGPADYILMQGTSMACPITAGVGALILSKNPNLTPAQVKTILENTATDKGTAGFDTTYGYGLVNASAAVTAATPVATSISISTPPAIGTGATVDAAFATQPAILVHDQFGNALSGVVVTASRGTTGTGTLQGTSLAATSLANGIATFSGLGYNKSGETFNIHFAAGSLTADSVAIGPLAVGAATQVKIETLATGSGVVVPTQSVLPGAPVTGYSVTRDQYNNFIANAAAVWSLTHKTGSVADSDLVPNATDNKSAVFTGHLTGSATIHAVIGSLTVDSNVITVGTGVISQLGISYPSSTVAGVVHDITVTAQDAAGNTITGYTGTIHFTSSDSQAVLPANYTFTTGSGNDNGTHTFTATATTTALKTAGTQSITAADTVTGSITGTKANIAVTHADAGQIRIETASTGSGVVVPVQSIAAGSAPLTVYCISRDAFGNFIANTAATWSLTNKTVNVADGDLVPNATDNKSAVFTGHLVGSATIHAAAAGFNIDSNIITVTAGALSRLSVSGFATPTVAGIAHDITVTAQDASGNTITGYAGAVHFTSSDSQAVLPADYTFITGDNGTKTITATTTLKTVGSQSITATSTGTGPVTGTQGGIIVNAAAASQIRIETASTGLGVVVPVQSITAGSAPLTVYCISRDAFGNFIANTAATWSLTNKTVNVVDGDLVPNATDHKSAVFTGHLVGSATIHAAAAGFNIDSNIITVTAGALSRLSVSGYPLSTIAGVAHDITVTAQDASGNTVTGYAGAVHFTSSDSQAVLPADYTFIAGDNGTKTITAATTLKTAGTQSITATSTGTGPVTGTQSGIAVTHATADRVRIETAADGSGSLITARILAAGSTLAAYAVTRDPFGNYVDNVTGTWSLNIVSGGIVNGDLASSGTSAIFTAHLAGTATIHLAASGFTSDSGLITVGVGTVSKFSVSGFASPTVAGIAHDITVTAQDASGNIITGYTGTIHFTSSDSLAVLPPDYTFIAGDNGTKTITATATATTLKTAGTQSITATQVGSTTITGTQTGIIVNAAPTSKLIITSSAQTLTAGVSSNTITVQRQDQYNNPNSTDADLTITLASNSTGTRSFRDDGDTIDITTVTILNGHNSAAFKYKDTKAGTPTISVTAGSLTVTQLETVNHANASQIIVETLATGLGVVVPAQSIAAGSAPLTVYCISRDTFGNFIANTAADSWSLTNKTGSVADGDLVPNTGNLSAVFTGHLTGSATIHAVAGIFNTNSGLITVGAGAISRLSVSGFTSPTTAGVAHDIIVTAQDASGNTITAYTGTVHFTSSDSQAVLPSDYTFIAGDNGTKTITATTTLKTAGTQSIIATQVGSTTITGTQSSITVNAAGASQIRIETGATGSAVPVSAQTVYPGSSLTVYSNTRDQYGNFIANTAATTWSLTSITPNMVSADLVPAGDLKSAIFTGHLTGSAVIHAVLSPLTPVDSGLITVSQPPPPPPPPPSGGGGGGGFIGGPSAPVSVAGVTDVSNAVNAKGVFTLDVDAWSDNKKVVLVIGATTSVTTPPGTALTQLSLLHLDTVPAFPTGANVIGLAYDFQPAGMTFNPAVFVRFSYDPKLIPDGVAETSLQIACFDTTANVWVPLPSTVDINNKFITASLTHFSTYAVTYGVKTPPPAVTTTPPVTTTIPVIVTTTSTTPVVTTSTTLSSTTTKTTVTTTPTTTPTTTVTTSTSTVKPNVAPLDVTSSTTVTTTKSVTARPWLIGVIVFGAVLVIALVIGLLVRNKKSKAEKK